ncbi:hypothetical protein ACET3Z_028178 [Daucus carota]
MQNLEQVYGQALDNNTKLYAKYYKDCMNFDSATSKKLMPIAELQLTLLHVVSQSIPDNVKFGPVLPKTAGFNQATKAKDSSFADQAFSSEMIILSQHRLNGFRGFLSMVMWDGGDQMVQHMSICYVMEHFV